MNDKPTKTVHEIAETYRGVEWVGKITELRGPDGIGYVVSVAVSGYPAISDGEEGPRFLDRAKDRCREIAHSFIDAR